MKLSQLHPNEGQIAGVPRNPRQIKEAEFRKLKQSLQTFRSMLEARPIVVDEDWNILGGNMRYQALLRLAEEGAKVRGFEFTEDIPDTWVKQVTTWTAEQKAEFVIKDNNEFGEYDWDMIANEWDSAQLTEWGVDVPEWDVQQDEDVKKEKPEKNEQAEVLLTAAMKQYCGEFRQQLDDAMTHGWMISGMSRGYAKLKFLRAKYYGERYENKNAVIFAPEIFWTASGKCSYYETLRRASERGDAGLSGFRTLTEDGSLLRLLGQSYPIIGKSALDFPVSRAREMYSMYARAGRVLDPCHGWGGRQIGALLEQVREYVGIDPSPIANRAARDIYDTFGEYQQTACRFIQKPYEETTDDEVGTGFDFAFTSPPYFDIEDYAGDEQSHKKYDNYKLWVQKFYEPLIVITMRRLKPDGAFALQVGSQTYPLRKDAEEICKRNGLLCEVIQTKTLNGDNLHGTDEEHAECTLLITKPR